MHRNFPPEKIQSGGEKVKHETHFVTKKKKKAIGVKKEQRNNKIQLVNHNLITFFIGP